MKMDFPFKSQHNIRKPKLDISHTYSTAVPLGIRKNDLKHKIGVPLYDAYQNKRELLKERDRRCREDCTSNEGKIFGDVYYTNTLRKEFANEKMRSALVALSQTSLFKHEIKKKAREVQRKIAKWDNDIGRILTIDNDDKIDLYDGLLEYAYKEFERLYTLFYFSVMQMLTKYECKQANLMAAFECSLVLCEYANKGLLQDIGAQIFDCPTIQSLGCMVEEDIYKTFQDIRNLLTLKLSPKDAVIDLNKDKNITTAADNLLGLLADRRRMRDLVQSYFTKRDNGEI